MGSGLFAKGLRFVGWSFILLLLPVMLVLAFWQIKVANIGWQRK